MILNLLRHAKAESGTDELKDLDRKLTAKGRSDTFKRAGKLRKKLCNVMAIITSPAPRSHETAEIFAAVLKKSEMVVSDDALVPTMRAEEILKHLRSFTGHGEILVVGHQPWLTGVAGLLFANTPEVNIKLKKNGLIRLDVEIMEPGGATLLSLN